MAVSTKRRGGVWSRFHFLFRALGLTGLVAAGVGFLLVAGFDWSTLDLSTVGGTRSAAKDVWARFLGEAGEPMLQWGIRLLAVGVIVAVVALLIEALAAVRQLFGRRGVFGTNVAVQVGLATALLVGVNLYSFRHYLRFDWTTNREFTLPADLRSQLAELNQQEGKTTIVIYQKHNTFGQLAEKRNAYDYAAERMVVEKVKDLVDQFREFGPQFKVVVLDEEKEDFEDNLNALTKNAPLLRDAIQRAPVNSIFFYTPGHVQQLTFNDFYQLDKTASEEHGNLVLVSQGVGPIARKVLNIGEKRPRIAIAVMHEALSTEGPEYIGLGGIKKMLMAHGFDTRDIILKRIAQRAPGDPRPPEEPAVYSYEESRYDSLERRIPALDAEVQRLRDRIDETKRLYDGVKSGKIEPLAEVYARRAQAQLLLQGLSVNMKDVTRQLEDRLKQAPEDALEEARSNALEEVDQELTALKNELERRQQDRDAAKEEKARLRVESAAEMRRMTDLKSKLQRLLADCDLLIIPRLTIHNIERDEVLQNSAQFHRMTDDQVAAIKEFLKAGKPVLACFGPPDDASAMNPMSPTGGEDNLEALLGQLGIHFGNQTVLYLAERDALKEKYAEMQGGGMRRRRGVFTADVDIPPVDFGRTFRGANQMVKADKPNPIRESLRLTARSLGKNQALNLRVLHPRPVYYTPPPGLSRHLKFDPILMLTDPASWNEDRPIPSPDYLPAPPDSGESSRPPLPFGTPHSAKKTYGPFPIGVALETRVPADWYADDKSKPATVRVAAIGSGSLFVTSRETPAKDKLLLDTCNWLLGRDDQVAQSTQPWSYPRVEMSERDESLWHWGTRLGLPGAFAYLGLVVLMVRRLR